MSTIPRDPLRSAPSANDEVTKLFGEIFAQHKNQLRLVSKINRYRFTQQGNGQNDQKLCESARQTDEGPIRTEVHGNQFYSCELYFLSDFASCLLLEVPRRTILHKDVLYHDTFTGKQFISVVYHHLRKYLPIKMPLVDREYALALTRSLQLQQFLVTLDVPGSLVPDDIEHVLTFSSDGGREKAKPTASGTCYSLTCPRLRHDSDRSQTVRDRALWSTPASFGESNDGLGVSLRLMKEEEDFIHQLSLIETHVIHIIRTAHPSWLGTRDTDKLISDIFYNLTDIKGASQKLLAALDTRIQEHTYDVRELGNVLMTAFKQFSLSYPMYLENLPRALNRLQLEREKNSHFDRILRQCENLPVLGRVPLSSLLVLPFKHLQNYPRRLEDLCDEVDEGNSGVLSEAIDAIKSILSVSRLLHSESEMACMDRRPKYTGFPEDLTDEICENPAEQSESELSDSSPPTPDSIPTGPSAILEDELSDIDISTQLAKFNEQIDASLMGGFGIVRKGLLMDGTDVAIKTLKLHHIGLVNIKHSKRFGRELRVWRRLKHINVLPFLGVLEVRRAAVPLSLVSPWMKNGNSLEFCAKHPDVLRMPIINGVADGLAHLHSQNVVHGDIKATNILISNDGAPLICDFGLAYVCDSTEDQTEQTVSTTVRRAGSLRHMAIELHQSETPGLSVSRESDIWALGMLCIELLSGRHPFHGQSEGMVVVSIITGRFPERPFAAECQDWHWVFIQRCWEADPRMRPSANEAAHELQ